MLFWRLHELIHVTTCFLLCYISFERRQKVLTKKFTLVSERLTKKCHQISVSRIPSWTRDSSWCYTKMAIKGNFSHRMLFHPFHQDLLTFQHNFSFNSITYLWVTVIPSPCCHVTSVYRPSQLSQWACVCKTYVWGTRNHHQWILVVNGDLTTFNRSLQILLQH